MNENEIIYIYISGYEKEYQENLYRTLSLPEGTVVRYTFKENQGLYDPKTLSRYQLLIVFVDRTCQSDYEFYPIREASFKSARTNKNDPQKVNLFVRLGRYVFPRNCNAVSDKIKALTKRPRPSSNPNAPTNDGTYVAKESSIIRDVQTDYYIGDEAWLKTAQTLYDKPAFCADLSGKNKNLDNYDPNQNHVPLFFHVKCVEKKARGFSDLTPHCEIDPDGSTKSYYQPLKNTDFICEWAYCLTRNLPPHNSLCPRLKISYVDKDGKTMEKTSSDPEDTDKLEIPIFKDSDRLTVGMSYSTNAMNTPIYCPEIELKLRPKSMDLKRIFFCILVVLGYVAVSFTLDEKDAILEIRNAHTVGNHWLAIWKDVTSNWFWLLLHLLRLVIVLFAAQLFDNFKHKVP